MKKSIVLAIALCASLSVFADYEGAGYYRVRNLKTTRWCTVVDDYGRIDYGNTTADLVAIRLHKSFDYICSDPGSILYIYPVGPKYQMEAQGTGIEQIIGHYADLTQNGTSKGEKLYLASGTMHGSTKYLGDAQFMLFQELGNMQTNCNGDYRRWFIRPLSDEGENFFGVKITVESKGKYYASLYCGFPFSAYSEGVKAYYVSGVFGDMACLEEIDGTVPISTPVIMECTTDQPTTNRLHVGGTASKLSDNKLTGVYFCRDDVYEGSQHYKVTRYNPATMRVLGTLADGSLGFVTATDLEFIPANSCYLSVPEGSPAEFRCVDKDEYMAGIDEVAVEDGNHATDGTNSDVYNMQGVLLIRNATPDQIASLPRGLYIVGGKKIRK